MTRTSINPRCPYCKVRHHGLKMCVERAEALGLADASETPASGVECDETNPECPCSECRNAGSDLVDVADV